MGGIDTYRSETQSAEIFFLDYEECDVKWMKYIRDMVKLNDLSFVSESNNIAVFLASSSASYFCLINN